MWNICPINIIKYLQKRLKNSSRELINFSIFIKIETIWRIKNSLQIQSTRFSRFQKNVKDRSWKLFHKLHSHRLP